MKIPRLFSTVLTLCFLLGQTRAAENSEPILILTLQADLSAPQKAAACLQLKNIATPRAVPALADCLDNLDVSHAAREALEVIPGVEADVALRAALDRTTGLLRAGILNSIGLRRDTAAIPRLSELLRDPDIVVANAAAHALGRIAKPECVKALQDVLVHCPVGVRPAVLDGMLQCGHGLLIAGERKKACQVFQELSQLKEPAHIRQAALYGWLLALGRDASTKLEEFLQGSDSAAQMAGLQAAAVLPGASITKTLMRLVEQGNVARQIAILKALAQRGDAIAVPAVLRSAKSTEAEVRRVAYDALVDLGDETVVLPQAEAAASDLTEQSIAAQSLAALHRGKPGKKMMELLPKASPKIQGELIRALALRRDVGTLNVFVKYGPTLEPQVQVVTLQALGQMADVTCLPALMSWMTKSKTNVVREAFEACFVTMAGKNSKTTEAMVTTMINALPGLAVSDRCSYLRSLGRMGGPKVDEVLRAGISDRDATVRETCLRTLAAYGSPATLPELQRLANEAETETFKVLALRGYWRGVGLCGDRSGDERLKLCQDGLKLSRRAEEKRLGLAELAKITSLPALQFCEKLTTDATVQSEAELACYQLSARLLASHSTQVSSVLQKLAAHALDEAVRTQATVLLKSVEQRREFITSWLVNGPYRVPGKQAQELFDIVFEPEKQPAQGNWKPATPPADVALFWQVDLGPLMAGTHAVAYLKSRVFVPSAQEVRLEMGSDDGVKLWLNGKLTHSNNVIRGLKAGQDKAPARLQSGWNDFLVKVTQHNQGSGFCLRICTPDGKSVPGLKYE